MHPVEPATAVAARPNAAAAPRHLVAGWFASVLGQIHRTSALPSTAETVPTMATTPSTPAGQTAIHQNIDRQPGSLTKGPAGGRSAHSTAPRGEGYSSHRRYRAGLAIVALGSASSSDARARLRPWLRPIAWIVWISPEIRQPTMTTVTAARHVTASGLRDPSPKVKKIRATKPRTTLAPICIAVTAASSCLRGSEAIMVMTFPLNLAP